MALFPKDVLSVLGKKPSLSFINRITSFGKSAIVTHIFWTSFRKTHTFQYVDHDQQRQMLNLPYVYVHAHAYAYVCLSVNLHVLEFGPVDVYAFGRSRQAANGKLKNLSPTR